MGIPLRCCHNFFLSDSSDRWKRRMQDNKTGTSRQSSVKDRWPPADKEDKTSRFTSSPKRETSRTAELPRQKPPSGSSSTTSNSTRSSTATNSGQTNFSSSTNTSTHRSSRSSKTSEHDMTQRNTTSKTHAPTAGSLASQSGESSAVGSDRKTHTSSESQTIPEPKQITVVESPTHLQQKTNFTTGSGRNPRNSSSSSSVATIAISSRKTPSPELPASHHLSATRNIHLYEG